MREMFEEIILPEHYVRPSHCEEIRRDSVLFGECTNLLMPPGLMLTPLKNPKVRGLGYCESVINDWRQMEAVQRRSKQANRPDMYMIPIGM